MRDAPMPDAPTNPFFIRWAKFPSGERMPFLVCGDDGLPLEDTVDWVVTQRRAYKQARTLEADLRHLQSLYLWADAHSIDLSARISTGRLFTDEEVRNLLRFCGWRTWRAADDVAESRALIGRPAGLVRSSKVVALRRGPHRRPENVAPGVKRNRIQSVHAFLQFLSGGHERRLAVHGSIEDHAAYAARRASCLEVIEQEYKSIQAGTASPRTGLAQEHEERMRQVIDPDHPENPWSAGVRIRNRLIVLMLMDLGIRRGELLVLRTDDLVFASNRCTVSVHRRPDDPLDPRASQPTTKTLARELSAGNALSALLHEYVTDTRRAVPGARRHPFLIVDGRNGRPLSLWAVNKVFEALRTRVPGLPSLLTPHAMRHTWNDRFSRQAEKKGVSPEREEKLRKHQMGWSPKSSMAARYTKRHTEREANKLSVEMQEGLGPLSAPDGDESA